MFQNKRPYLPTFSVGVLIIGLTTASYKLCDLSVKNKELKDKITLEKSIHQNQISEILRRYDSVNEKQVKKTTEIKDREINGRGYEQPEQNLKFVNKRITEAVDKKLSAKNINARAVRMISQDFVETTMSSKIDQVRVRFTLEENKDFEPGKKKIFIQIINPKNRLLALKGKSETEVATEVYYDRHSTDVCVFIDLHQYQLIVGDYKINLIHDGAIIGSTNFRVN